MQERKTGEVWGKRARNLGLVGAIIGLIALPEILLASLSLAASGEIFSRQFDSSKK